MELFQDYTVGNTYGKWKTGAILTQTEFDGTSLVFVYGVPAPTQVETHAFLLGDLMMSFAVVDDLPFVLLNIDNCGWMDAPFEPHGCPANCFGHTFGAGEALPVIFLLVDTRYGKLLQIRACGFSTAFSNGFLEECRRIRALPWGGMEEYLRKTQAAYSRYPTSGDMLAASRPEWISGIIKSF